MEEPREPQTRLRTIVVFAMLFAVLGAVVVFAYFATFSRPVTTVILVRHAEKKIEPNNPDPDLAPDGVARSGERRERSSPSRRDPTHVCQRRYHHDLRDHLQAHPENSEAVVGPDSRAGD